MLPRATNAVLAEAVAGTATIRDSAASAARRAGGIGPRGGLSHDERFAHRGRMDAADKLVRRLHRFLLFFSVTEAAAACALAPSGSRLAVTLLWPRASEVRADLPNVNTSVLLAPAARL